MVENIYIEKPVDYLHRKKELLTALPHLEMWKQKQNDTDDKKTDFIYDTYTFQDLIHKIKYYEQAMGRKIDKYYAMNRWYNWLSSDTIEAISASFNFVRREPIKNHKTIDIHMKDLRKGLHTNEEISTDIKLTVFPKKLKDDNCNINEYKSREKRNELIKWLYVNQSRGRRFHQDSRMFIIVEDSQANNRYETKAKFDIISDKIKIYFNYINQDPARHLNFIPLKNIFPDNEIEKEDKDKVIYTEAILIDI